MQLRGGGDEDAAASGTLPELPAARLVILPATSHIENRTHFLPAASNGIESFFVPNACISVAEITFFVTVFPSPVTISMNAIGYVHSTSAVIVRCVPEPLTA